MSDPSLELQIAMVEALKDCAAAVGSRVYDVPPAKPAFPYIQVGDIQVLPDKADCIDGLEVYPLVHIWSREVGFTQAKTIGKAVVAKLDDQALSVVGYAVVVFELNRVDYMRDPDGLTQHGAITFRALIQAA